MNQSRDPKDDRRDFLRQGRDLRDRLVSGEVPSLDISNGLQACDLDTLIQLACVGDPEGFHEAIVAADEIRILLEWCSDLSRVDRIDSDFIAALRKLGSRLAISRNSPNEAGPVSVSQEEFASQKSTRYLAFVEGPAIKVDDLIEVVGLLRQVGQEVVGVYSNDASANVYYRPAIAE